MNVEKCKPSIWNIMLHFFRLQLHTNEWGRSLEECEGHHEVHISTTGAKFLMPDGMRWDVKPLLITMLLALIASVLFSNCFVSVDLWLLITSSWNAPQIIPPSLCSLTSKSSCHLAPARAAPIKEDGGKFSPYLFVLQENYSMDKWMLQTLFRTYFIWIAPVFPHSSKPVTFALQWN